MLEQATQLTAYLENSPLAIFLPKLVQYNGDKLTFCNPRGAYCLPFRFINASEELKELCIKNI